MAEQVKVVGRMIDIYTPIFTKMILLTEKTLNGMNKACPSSQLDPAYLGTLQKIKSKLLGAIYTRKLANNQEAVLAKTNGSMAVTAGAQYTDHNVGSSMDIYENFSQEEEQCSDKLFTWIMLILAIVVIYLIVIKYNDGKN